MVFAVDRDGRLLLQVLTQARKQFVHRLQHAAQVLRLHLELPHAAGVTACEARGEDDPCQCGQADSAASRRGGDIGSSVIRLPVAISIALAMAAIGGQMFTSPTPFAPYGWVGFGTSTRIALDHRQVGRDRAAIIQEARVIELTFGVVDIFLVQRPADALHDAALDLAFHVAGMDGAPDVLGGDEAQDGRPGRFPDRLPRRRTAVEKPGAWPPALTPADAVIGPPVAAAFAAISFNDSGLKSPTLDAAGLA